MEFLFIWLLFPIVTAIVANNRGRSGFGWFVLGLFFGFFALILVALLPSQKIDPSAPTPETHVKCPDCRELVLKDACKCKHCGCKLTPVVESALINISAGADVMTFAQVLKKHWGFFLTVGLLLVLAANSFL